MRCSNMQTVYPYQGKNYADMPDNDRSVEVPCGKCIPCLISKRSDWVFRLEQEYKYSKSAYFVTLTYDQKHLRYDESLSKSDLQLYFKRLRKREGQNKIRYYAVGEYGSKSGRPHYHILLFNATSEENIRAAWRDIKKRDIGMVHIGRVNSASIAYTTKYILQPQLKAPAGKEKAFSVMSRAYGIGGKYLSDEMTDWHRRGDKNYTVKQDNVKGRLPRFYREKIWYKPKDRERISSAAMQLTLKNQKLEEDYYKQNYGSRWQEIMLEFRTAVLQRVSSKIKYTQRL